MSLLMAQPPSASRSWPAVGGRGPSCRSEDGQGQASPGGHGRRDRGRGGAGSPASPAPTPSALGSLEANSVHHLLGTDV